jgi:uncharacterized protein (TIGR02270 family)
VSEATNVLWEVVEEHLDDAEFLWTQWETALGSPAYTLGDVAERDEERLLANVDGLVTAGVAARARLLHPALEADAPGRRSAAALALLVSGDPAAAAPVLRLLREGDAPLRASAERALGLAGHEGDARLHAVSAWIDDALRAVLHDAAPAAQAAALSALAFRRASPGAALSGLRGGDDPELLAAAFRSAAATADKVPPGLVVEGLVAVETAVRDAAITAGLSLGLPEAWVACQKLVRRGHAEALAGAAPAPLFFAATLGDARDVEPFANATDVPALRRAAVWALGYSGRVSAAEACLRLLGDPDLGKLAGEAFAAITGLPSEARFLAAPPVAEPDEPVPFAAENLDQPLIPTPEDALPLLDPIAVEAWWGERRARFERARRYLGGAPWGRESVLFALAHGPMRRRRWIAAEVAVRTRGRVQVETRAFSARQRVDVAAAESIAAGELERPFG